MSTEATRDRGKLFANAEKKKPSQPDLLGDCTIDRVVYELRGYRRGDGLTIHLAPPRGDRNTYPPDVFKGTLDAVEKPRAPKGKRGAPVPAAALGLAWVGVIVSADAAYRLSATEKQGKSDIYWTLSFERVERPVAESAWTDDDDVDSAG
ncbi:MAG: hypothetical protein IPL61_15795 [Myxococcales bacterium]|nr:hypothetical protein [Myxococcales bacterium]